MMLGLLVMIKLAEWRKWTVPKMFAATVKRIPDKVMFFFEDEVWSFKDVEEHSNRVARFFMERGLKKGESVAIFMENRPTFVTIW